MSLSMININAAKCILLTIAVLTVTIFNGCTTINKVEEPQVKDVDLLMLASPEINPNDLGRPSPIRVDLFQLSEKADFVYTDYLSLIENNDETEENLIDRQEFIISPDELHYSKFKVYKDTEYLGVVVGFQHIDEADWKLLLIKQPNYWGNYTGYLNLKVNEYSIKQLSKREMQAELEHYAATHPENEQITKSGLLIKPKPDYSKGMFVAE